MSGATRSAGRAVAGLTAMLSAGVLALGAATATAEPKEPIKLDAGLLGGSTESSKGVRAFRGIPFAAPPVGALRWQPPQPVAKWDGVRAASKFGNVCIQFDQRKAERPRLNIAVMDGSPPLSEDCLYLNVWTPAASANDKLPVMLYWFGGGFTEGAGSVPLYDGDALARKGVIVVTMNYRLGPFGFFVHPALTAESPHKASGNYGLMDMLASARWVQNNIAALGGDPSNVTVFGQSAGAMAIGSLVASPEAKGLFRRAISQSGAWMGLGMSAGMRTRAQAEETGAKAAGNITTAEQLRAMSADNVAEKLSGAGMLVDGWVIPEDPTVTFANGRQNAVDVLVGSNKDEASFLNQPVTSAKFEEGARMRWGDLAADYLKLYPHATDAEAVRSTADNFDDGAYWHMRLYADYQAKKGNKAYLYYFAQNPPNKPGSPPFPAAHASELPYVFRSLGQLHLFPDGSDAALAAASAPDRKLADLMSSYWANFARSGDPNGKGLPEWKAHTPGSQQDGMLFDADAASDHLPAAERLAFLDKLWDRQQQPAQ